MLKNIHKKAAAEAARKAGKYAQLMQKNKKSVQEKQGSFDIVTNVDIEAQKLMVNVIKNSFPKAIIFAEEQDNKSINHTHDLWALDPIDGTSAYASGLPTFSSSVAFIRKRKVIAGAVYLALFDCVVNAGRNNGAFLRKKKLTVNTTEVMSQSSIGFDPGYPPRSKHIKNIAAPLSDKARILPLLWSQATALALVGMGVLDGYVQCGNPKVWDVAAGKLIVEEAGGKVTDLSGKKLDIFNINGYIAGNPQIHKKLLEFVATYDFN